LCCLVLGACAEIASEGPERYVVRPEDTLYSIAWRHDIDYRDLARWNHIGADFRIRVGQVLVLGPGGAPTPESSPPRAQGTPRAQNTPRPPDAPRVQDALRTQDSPRTQDAPRMSQPRPPAEPAPASANGPSKWVWPTDRIGAPRPVPGGGILLSGHLGQDVRAACTGRVVYSGSGLRGYGNLIIVKHADNLLSAYAHNREMLVHDGQEVAMGQVIAHMGESARHSSILYFEIRQNGKPIDPLPLLAK
jgi:lipoprotein NlpD